MIGDEPDNTIEIRTRWNKLCRMAKVRIGHGVVARHQPVWPSTVCLAMKLVGKPDAGNPHVRFDERGEETGCRRTAQATAPLLDSTIMPVGQTSRLDDLNMNSNGSFAAKSSRKR